MLASTVILTLSQVGLRFIKTDIENALKHVKRRLLTSRVGGGNHRISQDGDLSCKAMKSRRIFRGLFIGSLLYIQKPSIIRSSMVFCTIKKYMRRHC